MHGAVPQGSVAPEMGAAVAFHLLHQTDLPGQIVLHGLHHPCGVAGLVIVGSPPDVIGLAERALEAGLELTKSLKKLFLSIQILRVSAS